MARKRRILGAALKAKVALAAARGEKTTAQLACERHRMIALLFAIGHVGQ